MNSNCLAGRGIRDEQEGKKCPPRINCATSFTSNEAHGGGAGGGPCAILNPDRVPCSFGASNLIARAGEWGWSVVKERMETSDKHADTVLSID